jgi:hypothetical protein
MDTELPYILKAQKSRGLTILWVLVSDCLYKKTPLEPIKAALPIDKPLEAMSNAARSTALRMLWEKIEAAWVESERPTMNMSLTATKVGEKTIDLKVLAFPARRRTEVFVRSENSEDWYHQGPIFPGQTKLTCYFGGKATKPGKRFHIMAMTTDLPVPHQKGKPTKPLPKKRTRSKDEICVVRA